MDDQTVVEMYDVSTFARLKIIKPDILFGYEQWLANFSVLQERTQVADWYPILKPLFLRLPSMFSSFLKTVTRLKDQERALWMSLLERAKDLIASGKMHPSW